MWYLMKYHAGMVDKRYKILMFSDIYVELYKLFNIFVYLPYHDCRILQSDIFWWRCCYFVEGIKGLGMVVGTQVAH